MSSPIGSGVSYSREGVATTAAVDLFEITLDPERAIRVGGLWISQSSDVGDAQEEMLRWRLVYGNTTSGSGGASADLNSTGYGGFLGGIDAVESFNTTQATGGSVTSNIGNNFNIRAGEQLWFPPSFEPILLPPDASTETNAVRLMAAPADSLTLSAVVFLCAPSMVY